MLCVALPPALSTVWLPLYKKDIKLYVKEVVVILLKLSTGYLDALFIRGKRNRKMEKRYEASSSYYKNDLILN